MVTRLSVTDFTSLAGGAEVFEITVTERSPLAETTLQETDQQGLLDDEILVVAIERGEEIVTPRGNTTIHAGDLVTVFSKGFPAR